LAGLPAQPAKQAIHLSMEYAFLYKARCPVQETAAYARDIIFQIHATASNYHNAFHQLIRFTVISAMIYTIQTMEFV
jgi:hypothetical protein